VLADTNRYRYRTRVYLSLRYALPILTANLYCANLSLNLNCILLCNHKLGGVVRKRSKEQNEVSYVQNNLWPT